MKSNVKIKSMNRVILAVLVATSIAIAPLIATAGNKPDATIDISANNGAIGLGYAKGIGTLYFRGTSYPLQVEGLTVDELEPITITGSGEVYNLTRVDDLEGNYFALPTDATLGCARQGIAMRNQRGVVIELHEPTENPAVKLSID